MVTSTQVKRRTAGEKTRDSRRRQRGERQVQAAFRPGTPIPRIFKPFSDRDAQRVHQAAVDLLEKVGMADATPRAIQIALDSGCKLTSNGRLLFPKSLVEDAIAKAAKDFIAYGRDERFDVEARNGIINTCTGGAAVTMLDMDTREYRPSTLKDLFDLARLCDTLENIQWFTRPIVATDLEDLYELDVNTVYACAAGTKKHISTSIATGNHVYKMVPMLDLLAGGEGKFATRPFCTVHATTVVSPMTFAPESLEVAFAAVDIGMIVHLQTGPQAGATSPAALAGTVVQGCAESLASLTILNLLKPGHPVIVGNWVFVSDLRTGAFSGGGGEQALLGAASGQMAAFYGIPGAMGAGMTDSKVPDNQAGFEKALTLLTGALSGGGFVFESAGMLASLLGCSFEAMVIDDDMLASVHRIARGIEVTDETLSVSVVEDSVADPGHFLGHSQTIQLMETEYTYPKQADRQTPLNWKDAGGLDIWDRATEKARNILSAYYPQCIDDETDRQIRENYAIRLPTHQFLRRSG